MTTNDEQLHIKACLQAIETKLNWGAASGWSSADFEKLAALIADDTEVQLSVSTLKRVWGKVTYLNAPSQTTLNTLAMYLGYADWRTYQQQFRPAPVPASTSLSTITEVRPVEIIDDTTVAERSANEAVGHLGHTPPRKKKGLLYAAGGILLALAVIGFMGVKQLQRPDPGKFRFSANKIASEGVPNTVIFHYDASAAHTDSTFIVQTWDIRRKTHVPKDKHEHSAIYYYPGFFRARLIADGEEVKAHNLMISSNGWLCLAENNPVPHYFRKEEYLKADRVEVDTTTLKTYGLSLYPTAPRLRFFNERDLGTLQSDRFVFETKVKSDFSSGSGACQYADVLIQCKNDIIFIPLAAKTCTGDLHLTACGANIYSKHADLSGFGADLSNWVILRVESSNRHMKFYVNGTMAYQLDFPNDPTGIVGVQYRFEGLGAVKDTWFKGGDTLYDFGVGK
ncbi:hypothetical protein [Paraflavitalea sp. CAU 1676]|uniref:hypothetical protein n=1 Tax=Paraflavitalea sp. CAU 1676 TaxID=3032598 RepID=UPI0023DC3061|nr:hypothetical protein [Paraflavitalea sp. CAU 1676]MDF2189882.1 hypothetical protein [Paraflavitalea sp. CAU 1676]